MSLAKGADFPQTNTRASNIPKVLHDHQNKQIQQREEIMVCTIKSALKFTWIFMILFFYTGPG